MTLVPLFSRKTEFGDDIQGGMDSTLLYGKTILRDVMSRVMPRYFGGVGTMPQ